ncbi:hypothetical protein B0H11DRAFT_2034191 [Mycena galericulata]|nr:hypothetical protein B0H11DRAFT_2034191 [Mycena galericulata]
MEAVEGAGRAGVGAGWHPEVSASPGVASFRDGEREGEGEALAGRRVIPTADARAPSPSPYRLSGLTERGYTPSLRSERDSVALDDEEREGEDGEEGEEGAREGEGEGEAPPTPTPYGLGQEHVLEGEEPPTVAVEVPSGAPHRDSLLSTHTRDSPATPSPRNSLAPSVRDSLAPSIRDSFSPSVRDSLLSADAPSQRDSLSSLSSTNTQILLLRRPLSAIDTGSPSHVALAHRVPVLGVVGVAGAEQLFVPAGRTPTATPTNTPPANTLGPEWGAGDAERQTAETTHAPRRTVSAGAPRPSTTFDARPLPSAPASSSASTFPRARTPDGSGNARGQAHGPEPPRTPPRRHAYTTGAPRPHTAYIPPAEDPEDALYRGVDEFGTVSFGGGAPHSFSAIVHGRVREGAGPAAGSGRNTDKWGHERPGYASGELAQLLAEAAALEVRLERGELPGEALRRRSMRPPPGRQGQGPAPPMPSMLSVVGEDKDKGREGARELKPQRSFRNPLSRSRSERRVRTDDVRPTAASSMGNLLALADDAQMARAPLSPTDSVPPTPPPKSPGFAGSTRYFSSLRRLASTSRSLGAAGAPGARGSVSTSNSSELSSEDSMGLVTPPDDGAAMQSGSNPTIAWPTLNTKRSVGSIGRNAASLAGRMFRTRTKSSASTHRHPPPPLPVPTLPSPPVLKLDSTPFVIPPIQTSLHETDASESPTSSTPIADPFISLSATPATAKPKSSTPPTRPPHLTLNTSASGTAPPPAGLLHIPKTAPESRPESWMSVSSGGSSSMAPSPLFDKAIFDAFPSVPDMPPPHARNTPLSAGPTGSTRQLPILPSSPPPAYSDHSFSEGATLLGRLAETNRRVNPLL